MQIFHSSRRKINLTTGIHAVSRGLNLFFQRRNWKNWCCVTACRQGFTLLEILIAILIFAVVIATLFSSFKAFIVSSEGVKANVLQIETITNVYKRISLDFESIFVLQKPRYKKHELLKSKIALIKIDPKATSKIYRQLKQRLNLTESNTYKQMKLQPVE